MLLLCQRTVVHYAKEKKTHLLNNQSNLTLFRPLSIISHCGSEALVSGKNKWTRKLEQ